jgi:transcriptional regulator of aromatic amino acid metabolism
VPRPSVKQLARLLDAVAVPIYIVDAHGRLAYVNAACAQWLVCDGAQLIGQSCRYHSPEVEASPELGGDPETSSPTPSQLAVALCPPPDLVGVRTAEVVCPRPQGPPSCRRALFIRLADEAGGASGPVLAVLDSADRDEGASPPLGSGNPGSAADSGGTAKRGSAADRGGAVVPAGAGIAAGTGGLALLGGTETDDLHARVARYRAAHRSQFGLERFIGNSAAIRRVRAQISLAASTQAPVNIAGPPGSGREHAARTIHYQRCPDGRGIVPLSCRVLAGELLLSTLENLRPAPGASGHDVAVSLVLNDVDELSADDQRQLAALLPHLRVERLYATSRVPLMELAARGAFQASLAAALSTLVIDIPPLAQRADDIPLLAQMCVENLNAVGGRQRSGFTPEALDALCLYEWPGDVAELIDVVRSAHERATAARIAVPDLPPAVRGESLVRKPRSAEPIRMSELLARAEREIIRRALRMARGNKTRAARLVGMSRPKFYRRLEQLGLAEEES